MKHRQIFYVPGLISLLGLPVLLLIWGPEDPVYYTVMRLKLPTEQRDSPGVLTFNRSGVMRLLKGKKIELLRFEERPSPLHPEYNPYRESAFLLNEMARQQFTHDTTEVLRVHFEDWNDYGDVVWMLNNAKIFDYRRYIYIDDDLYLLANAPPPPPTPEEKIEPLYIDGPDIAINQHPWTPPTQWDIFWERMSWKWQEFVYAVRRSKVLCVSFVLLILMPALVRMARNKKPALRRAFR